MEGSKMEGKKRWKERGSIEWKRRFKINSNIFIRPKADIPKHWTLKGLAQRQQEHMQSKQQIPVYIQLLHRRLNRF
jgi:hypothetical protein